MYKRLLTATLLSLSLALGLAVPSALAAPPVLPAPSAASTARTDRISTQTTAPERDRDAQRYAKAEAGQPAAANFEGGASVVIFGSTTAVVLAVVLLIILL